MEVCPRECIVWVMLCPPSFVHFMPTGRIQQVNRWSWLVEVKFVFESMPLLGIEYKGVKRNFKVDKVIPLGGVPKGSLGSSTTTAPGKVVIPAYKSLPTTAITILTSDSGLSTSNGTNGTATITKPGVTAQTSTALPPDCPPSPPAPPLPVFTQIGGLTPQLAKLKSLLLSTLYHSHHFTALNLTPFRGVLLYGPPGTGKSLIMRCLPGTLTPLLSPRTLSVYQIDGSVVGKYLGESEASIRKIFKEAKSNQPSIIFIDEVDSLAPKRTGPGAGEANEGRVVSTLMTELDELGDGGTVVVAATNRPNGIDEGLRRPGRLDREIEIPRPDVAAREEILTLMLSKVRKGWISPADGEVGEMSHTDTVSTNGIAFSPHSSSPSCTDPMIKSWAFRTHGFVGADLEAVVRGGVLNALSRLTLPSACPPTTSTTTAPLLTLSQTDIESTLKEIRPTAMREIFLETPNVRWSDIGGQELLKQRLREAVEWPLTHPEVFSRLGGTPRKGLLLYGPPGCSKTLTAKALATEAGLNFMPVKGPELLNMYVGESERAVREVFRKARAAAPSIIFFDEIDALGSSRHQTGRSSSSSSSSGPNVLTALLNEMDGIETLRGVTILAATNRPDVLDPALMRPGRLDTILYVGPPDHPGRLEILKIKTRRMSLSGDVDLETLAGRMEGYSGAEIVNICDEAVHAAMRESMQIENVSGRHFEEVMTGKGRGISEDMRRFYEDWEVGGVRKI